MEAFKIKNGISAKRYLGSSGADGAASETQYYDLTNLSYDSKSFSAASQTSNARSIFIKPDGTKMYLLGNDSFDDTVYQYTLSTAWDVSTASYDSKSYNANAQEGGVRGVWFKPDGTKMYIIGDAGDAVYQYSLSTAWDLFTVSYDSVSLSVSGPSTAPYNITFNPSGTKFYAPCATGDDVNEYTLSTAWDISTASYTSTLDTSALVTTAPSDVAFNGDGTKLFVSDFSKQILIYNLSTAYDISTATYDQDSLILQDEPEGIFFKSDGTKLYTFAGDEVVEQYSTTFVLYTQTLDLSTGTTFSFTPSGATTVSFTNPPATGIAIGFTVEINGDGSAITWPASVKWHGGAAPTAAASKELYAFVTTDGGTTYYGKKAGSNIA
jgi:DNA-binding beta-propeller fold protein YncE